jgi:hypothetical protein
MRYLLLLFSMSIALALAGCERSDSPESPMEPQTVTPETAEPAAPLDEGDTDAQSEADRLWNRATELAEEARNRAEDAWRVGQEEGGEAWERAKDRAAAARDRAEQAWDQAREFSGEAGEAVRTRTEAVWDDIKATWARMTEDMDASEAAEEPAENAVPAE